MIEHNLPTSGIINIKDIPRENTQIATVRFTATVGRLIVHDFETYWETLNHLRKLEVSYTKKKGWFEHNYFMTIKGPLNLIDFYLKDCNIQFGSTND